MPIREYLCQECGIFEVLDLSSGRIRKTYKCEKCGKRARLILSNCSVQFIGSGFYQTDYKSTKENNKNVEKTKKPNKET